MEALHYMAALIICLPLAALAGLLFRCEAAGPTTSNQILLFGICFLLIALVFILSRA